LIRWTSATLVPPELPSDCNFEVKVRRNDEGGSRLEVARGRVASGIGRESAVGGRVVRAGLPDIDPMDNVPEINIRKSRTIEVMERIRYPVV
jgi:hypothetical protein